MEAPGKRRIYHVVQVGKSDGGHFLPVEKVLTKNLTYTEALRWFLFLDNEQNSRPWLVKVFSPNKDIRISRHRGRYMPPYSKDINSVHK